MISPKIVPLTLRCSGRHCPWCRVQFERRLLIALRYAAVYGTFGAALIWALKKAYG